ncbi:MAG: hypothetical protein QXI93_04665 [Candidatus Methanomethylicia archaeon]
MGVEKLFSKSKVIQLLDSSNRRIGVVLLRRGEDVGFHGEGDFEERIIVLRGSGKIISDGSERNVSEGEIVEVKSCVHNVINDNSDILLYVYDCKVIK